MGCERDFYFNGTESTDLSDEVFAGISLDQNIHDIQFVALYGNQLESSMDHELYDYFKLENGIIIAATKYDGDIIRIMGDLPPTHKQITFGNTKKQILDVYGNEFYKRVEQGVDIIGYVDWNLHATLEFWLDEKNEIIIIRFDKTSVQ